MKSKGPSTQHCTLRYILQVTLFLLILTIWSLFVSYNLKKLSSTLQYSSFETWWKESNTLFISNNTLTTCFLAYNFCGIVMYDNSNWIWFLLKKLFLAKITVNLHFTHFSSNLVIVNVNFIGLYSLYNF